MGAKRCGCSAMLIVCKFCLSLGWGIELQGSTTYEASDSIAASRLCAVIDYLSQIDKDSEISCRQLSCGEHGNNGAVSI